MVIEQALLAVKPGQEPDFEQAFSKAAQIIAGMPGFQGLTLSTSTTAPNTYLLLVNWSKLEDHTEGFRNSPQYQEWGTLLHHFYDPFPAVEYYVPIITKR